MKFSLEWQRAALAFVVVAGALVGHSAAEAVYQALVRCALGAAA